MECSRFFRVSLGKFGQKSFAHPKVCPLLHLWLGTVYLSRIRNKLTKTIKSFDVVG